MKAIRSTSKFLRLPSLALLQRQDAEIAFPDPQQIESPKGMEVIAISSLQGLEVRKTVTVERGDSPIQDHVVDRNPGDRVHPRR